MGVLSNVRRGPACVADGKWLNVAAGLLPEGEASELLKHASQCGYCGPLLKRATETLTDEGTPSEEALLASLSSARPEWQQNMAATLRGSSPRILGATFVEQLLAQAYTEHRTLEVRIAGANYAPVRVERSAKRIRSAPFFSKGRRSDRREPEPESKRSHVAASSCPCRSHGWQLRSGDRIVATRSGGRA
jgi:hypothetical protein